MLAPQLHLQALQRKRIGGGGGGITLLVNTGKTGAANGVTTDAIDTSGADLIVAVVYYLAAGTINFQDSKSNTWTALTSRGTTLAAKIYWTTPSSVGGSHTFSTVTPVTSAGIYAGICVAAFSGANASPFDTDTGASSTQPGSISPAVANELFICCWGRNDSTTLTINSSFTITNQTTYAPGDGITTALAYKISGSAENPTTNSDDGTAMAAFKPA